MIRNVEDGLLSTVLLFILSGLYFYAAVAHSLHTYFWMDEVLAVSTAQLGSFASISNAIWNGAEFSPPSYDFILHCLTWLPPGAPDVLLFRLPSILALYGAAVCVRALLKPYVSPLLAVLGFGMALDSGLFYFAIQARPYALLAFGLSAALLLWVNIARGRHDRLLGAGLWFALAACVSLHFYGILALGVLGVAEICWWVERREIRWAVWLALLFVVPVVLAWYPLEAHLAQMNAADIYASGYHGKPTLARFQQAVFETILNYQMTTHLVAWIVFVTGFACLFEFLAQRSVTRLRVQDSLPRRENLPLYCTLIALAMLPFGGYLFSLCVTGTLSGRYISAAALLPGLAFAYLLNFFRGRDLIGLLTLPLIIHHLLLLSVSYDPLLPVMEVLAAPRQKLPVVVPEGNLYIALMYAIPTSERSQFVLLLTPPDVVSIDPTNEHQAERLACFHPEYQLQTVQHFVARNKAFYTIVNAHGPPDNVSPFLRRIGLLGHAIAQQDSVSLFEGGSAEAH